MHSGVLPFEFPLLSPCSPFRRHLSLFCVLYTITTRKTSTILKNSLFPSRDHEGTRTVREVAPLDSLRPPPAPPLLLAAPPPSAGLAAAPGRPLPLSRSRSPSPLTSAGTLPVRSLSLHPWCPALSSDAPEDASRPRSCPPQPRPHARAP